MSEKRERKIGMESMQGDGRTVSMFVDSYTHCKHTEIDFIHKISILHCIHNFTCYASNLSEDKIQIVSFLSIEFWIRIHFHLQFFFPGLVHWEVWSDCMHALVHLEINEINDIIFYIGHWHHHHFTVWMHISISKIKCFTSLVYLLNMWSITNIHSFNEQPRLCSEW